jgi:cysteine sulfinate desulfinase/cysteine desulfurase-like protein
MGVSPDLANCALRVSLGWETTAAEIDAFHLAWAGLAKTAGT